MLRGPIAKIDPLMRGTNIVAFNDAGKEKFRKALEAGINIRKKIIAFQRDKFSLKPAAKIKDFRPKKLPGFQKVRSSDKNALFLVSVSKQSPTKSKATINNEITMNKIGRGEIPFCCFYFVLSRDG